MLQFWITEQQWIYQSTSNLFCFIAISFISSSNYIHRFDFTWLIFCQRTFVALCCDPFLSYRYHCCSHHLNC